MLLVQLSAKYGHSVDVFVKSRPLTSSQCLNTLRPSIS